jgi:hypothetical protein
MDLPPLRLEVREAPAILTLMAQGGACADADILIPVAGTGSARRTHAVTSLVALEATA